MLPVVAMRILLTYIMLILVHGTPDVCFWGLSDTNEHINGLYTYGGIYNGKPYYNKTSDCDQTLYMYWSESDKLKINNVLGKSSSYAYCDISSDPNNCDGSWFVWSGSAWIIHSNVYTQSGSCPSWNCDQIQTSIPQSSGGCYGPFDQHIDDNMWRSSVNGRYLFFNPYYFRWSCNDDPMNISCLSASGDYYAKATDGWTDLSKGQSVELDFVYPQTETRTIICVGSPTLSPTNNPSSTPPTTTSIIPSVSNNITVSPTNNPSSTLSATNNITVSPTNNASSSSSTTSSKKKGKNSKSSTDVIVTDNQQTNGMDKLHLLLIIVIILISIIICIISIFCLAYFYKNKTQNKRKSVERVAASTNSSINRREIDLQPNNINKHNLNKHNLNKHNLNKLKLEMVNTNSDALAVNEMMDMMDKMNKRVPVNMPQPNIGSLPLPNASSMISNCSSINDMYNYVASSSHLQQPGSAENGGLKLNVLAPESDIPRRSSLSETYNNDDYKMEVSMEGSAANYVQPGSYPPESDKLDDMVMINYASYNSDNNDDARSDNSHLDVDAIPEQTATPNDISYCTEVGAV